MTSNKLLITFAILLLLVSFVVGVKVFNKPSRISTTAIQVDKNLIRYLPLGDSYTIGQNVAESDRWPNQLAASYKPSAKALQIVANPSVTGYTTQDLIEQELPLVAQLRPDFITIQIGVNDYVQGGNAEKFKKNLNYILDKINSTAHPKILLVTIPDYAKTPTGSRYGDPATSTKNIELFNQIIKDIGLARSLPVADIFEISQNVTIDPSLIGPDGLHPTAKQYSQWTAIIQKTLETQLPL